MNTHDTHTPDIDTPLGTPSRRSVVTATGASALAAGLAAASAGPATALSPATAPSTVPAAVPAVAPPGTDPRAYATVARAIAVYDEHDESLVPAYLRIVENGLPARRAKATKRVLVVGAGPTGLLAADLLNRAYHDVVVIEANGNRVGGRIKTFRKGGHENGEQPFADPLQYAEAGAMRLPESHPLLMALIEKFDLPRQEFYLVDVEVGNPAKQANRTWIHVNGVHMRRADYEKDPARINDTFGVTGDHRTKTAATILADALEPARLLSGTRRGRPSSTAGSRSSGGTATGPCTGTSPRSPNWTPAPSTSSAPSRTSPLGCTSPSCTASCPPR